MKTASNSKGFTLIELLTIVAIIGVLAAVAIPQFALYRQRGFDARAEHDLRNAAGAEEYWYVSNQSYVTCADAATCEANLPGYSRSPGVTLAMAGTANSYTGTASHPNGSRTFSYNSQGGGLQP